MPYKVLLVEDQVTNQMIGIRILERIGCTVDLAVNGLEAVEKIQQSSYDIIFMDCQMPDMDGLDATRTIRAWERSHRELVEETPIVAVTAGAANGTREECLQAGMNDYILKPVRIAQFAGALSHWCAGIGEIPFVPKAVAAS